MFRRDLPIERRRMLIGGFKRSGIGRENGMSAIREYRQEKSMAIDTQGSISAPFVQR